MESILMKIQETVVKYADIVSQISKIDVEVVDENLFRVAGTGMFKDKVNEDMSSEGYVYHQVLKTGERQVIYEPGREPVCRLCPHCNDCQEEIEISMPVRLDDAIIGIIGLVGSTLEQKERILRDEQLYLEFLEQIAEFISTKAKEYVEMENKIALLDTLDCTIEHMDQGVMVLGSGGMVTAANQAALRHLGVEWLHGLYVKIESTGDHMNHLHEYKVTIGDQEYLILGRRYNLSNATGRYSVVVLFENSMEVHNKYYEMTSTVQTLDCSNIIGDSPKTRKLKQEIMKVAKSTSTVLITGESGTGKEMVASAIWRASDRKNKKFIAINCAAIPEALLESELFGYVKGAFTGADPNGRIGKFELANKGVIFLDEIGDMPLYLQAKLLRVIQERKIVRIGSNQVIGIDVRIIAATNKNLKEMIREKKFREDLYYRLNVIPLELPPLRERKGDIEQLAVFFAKRYAELFGKKFWKITDSAMERLNTYPWEGNIRELENVVEFMINMMQEDGILNEETMPEELKRPVGPGAAHQESGSGTVKQPDAGGVTQHSDENKAAGPSEASLRRTGIESILSLKELEQREIRRAIAECGNTTQGKKEAAKMLGIGLATLYRKLEGMNQD